MRKLLRYWPIVPLIVLVLFSRHWAETTDTDIVKEDTVDMLETRADYYLEDFVTRRFNAEGMLEYKVVGNTLAHYPTDDRSEITQPQVSLFRPGINWHMESKIGVLTTNPEVFTLQGNVVVRRNADTADEVLIQTSDLEVLTEGNEVRTDKKIDIVAETWHLSATGLHSAIDEGKLVLESNVTGHFEVPAPLDAD